MAITAKKISEIGIDSMLAFSSKTKNISFAELAWEKGTFANGVPSNSETRIRIIGFLKLKKGSKIICEGSLEYNVLMYDEDWVFTDSSYATLGWISENYELENDAYVRVAIRYSDDRSVDDYPFTAMLADFYFQLAPDNPVFKNVIERNRHREDGLLAVSGFNQTVDRTLTSVRYKSNFAMPVITDIHNSSIASKNFRRYINEHQKYFDGAINLGDTLVYPSDSADFWNNEAALSEIPVMNVVGNHDKFYSSGASLSEVFTKLIYPLVTAGFISATENYYYKDFLTDYYKVRIIVLNNFDMENSANYASQGTYYSQSQLDWLAGLLYDTPDDYHVLIAFHAHDAGVYASVDSTFTTYPIKQDGSFESTWYKLQDGNPVYDIINAWKKSLSLNETYNAVNDNDELDDVTVSKDFSQRNSNGIFVTYISGHRHRSAVTTVPGYADQLMINFDVGSAYPHQTISSDIRKEENTLSEDNFCIMGVDTENKLIKLLKIGAVRTIYGEIRDFEAISYDL